MLELLSLFFGLVTGTRPVHVAPPPLTAAEPVVRVRAVAALLPAPGPPCACDCRSGPRPEPAVLRAPAARGEARRDAPARLTLPAAPARAAGDVERAGHDTALPPGT